MYRTMLYTQVIAAMEPIFSSCCAVPDLNDHGRAQLYRLQEIILVTEET